jgi:malate permease and related proteins
MLSSFMTISQKVLILFIMIAVGYVCGKIGLVTKRGAQQITSVLFYVVTPCLTISSLQSIIGQVSLNNILICALLAAAAMLVAIVISVQFFRKSTYERRKVLRFASAYSNCGFIGIPLVQAVLGGTGVAYASMFGAIYNFFVWSHGYAEMSGKRSIKIKQIILNPGLAGLAIGLPLFAFSYRIPELIAFPIDSFASLNTPLAMIVIGNFISKVDLKEIFVDADLYKLSAIRLLLIPFATFILLLPIHLDKAVVTTVLLLSAAPSGANTAMFAAQFGADAKLASKAIALTTLVSILTMPLFSVLASRLL